MISKKEWGDFQTPQGLADEVCSLIKRKNINPDCIIEPTCGVGNFIFAAKRFFNPQDVIGLEINGEYASVSTERFSENNVKIIHADFFQYDWDKISKCLADRTVLLLGNPPWVTNSDISSNGGTNVPKKSNVKRQRGIDALTGASNFDICEAMLIRLIYAMPQLKWIAVLCKTSVARNFYEYLSREGIEVGSFELYLIDAKKHFSASVGACLMYIDFSAPKSDICRVFHLSQPTLEIDRWSVHGGKISSQKSDLKIDGISTFVWRQGMKHDCSRVMELRRNECGYVNKLNECAPIEDELVFPLVKSSDIKKCIISHFDRYVLVTQKYIGQDTLYIKDRFPKTWEYLQDHAALFHARKSSIYDNSPDFSIFGVGEYSFARYKVALSGFYKIPVFALLLSEKSVMLDDTCYFISFDSYDLAYVATLLLNSQLVQNFLIDNSLQDAKRPYTKKLLQRIDFRKILDILSFGELKQIEGNLGLDDYLTQEMYDLFLSVVNGQVEQKQFSFA